MYVNVKRFSTTRGYTGVYASANMKCWGEGLTPTTNNDPIAQHADGFTVTGASNVDGQAYTYFAIYALN